MYLSLKGGKYELSHINLTIFFKLQSQKILIIFVFEKVTLLIKESGFPSEKTNIKPSH